MVATVRRWMGTTFVVSMLLLPGLEAASGPSDLAAGGPTRFEQVRDTTGGQDNAVYTVTGRENLGDVQKTLEVPLPFIDEDWTVSTLLVAVNVEDGVPDGRMIGVLSRVRDGKTRRLRRLHQKFQAFGDDQPSGVAATAVSLEPTDFQAGDAISIALTFKTDYQLRRDDRISYTLFWDFRDRLTLPPSLAPTDIASRAPDNLVGGERFAVLSRAQDYTIRPRTRLDEVSDVVDLWVPDFGDGSFSDEMRFFVAASVFTPAVDGASPVSGRMKARLFHYPADGGPRKIFARTSQKLEGSRASWDTTVPRPEGLGGGDRIAVEFSFRTDSETPRGDDSALTLLAQSVVINDR